MALPITAGTLSFYTPLTAVFIYYSERQAAGRQLTGNYPLLRRSTKVENTPERGVYKHKQTPGRETIKTSCLHRLTSGSDASVVPNIDLMY